MNLACVKLEKKTNTDVLIGLNAQMNASIYSSQNSKLLIHINMGETHKHLVGEREV